MAGIRTWLVNAILITIVVFCAISFGIFFPQANSSAQSLTNVQVINSSYNSIQNNFNSAYINATLQQNASNNAQPAPGFSFLIFNYIIGTVTTFGSVGTGMINVVVGLVSSQFGAQSAIIFTVFSTIMIASLVFLGYKLYKSGESDR